MLPSAQAAMVRTLEEALTIVRDLPVSTPCTACQAFVKGRCTDADAQPPPAVLPVGCEAFRERVPF